MVYATVLPLSCAVKSYCWVSGRAVGLWLLGAVGVRCGLVPLVLAGLAQLTMRMKPKHRRAHTEIALLERWCLALVSNSEGVKRLLSIWLALLRIITQKSIVLFRDTTRRSEKSYRHASRVDPDNPRH